MILLAVELGDRQREQWLHTKFRDMRLTGEWFVYGAPLIHHIMELDQLPMRLTARDSSGYRHDPKVFLFSQVTAYGEDHDGRTTR